LTFTLTSTVTSAIAASTTSAIAAAAASASTAAVSAVVAIVSVAVSIVAVSIVAVSIVAVSIFAVSIMAVAGAGAVVAVRPRALPLGACVLARSLPCRDAVACAAARFASCPRCHHNQAHVPVYACEASHVHMHVHVHMHIHMHVGMLDVAHVCVVWTSWVAVPAIPVRVSRAWNAQVSQCICHVGLSRNWGSITNGLSQQ
jgi:hypothetical protein